MKRGMTAAADAATIEDGGCPFLANPEDVTVDVGALGPDLEKAIYERLGIAPPEGDAAAAAEVYRSSFLGMIMPDRLDPLAFFGGLAGGTGVTVGASRLLDVYADVSPLWTSGGATVLALVGHILAKSSVTLGLLAGSAPVLLEQGFVAVLDLLMGEEEAAAPTPAVPQTTPQTEMTVRGVAGAGPGMGQLTRRSMEEIERVMRILQPGGANQTQRRQMSGPEALPSPAPTAPALGYATREALEDALIPTVA